MSFNYDSTDKSVTTNTDKEYNCIKEKFEEFKLDTLVC